jgi:hypothetical protein
MTEYTILTDNWWNWFVHEYAFTMAIVWALLKGLAILDPSNKTDKIVDLLRGCFTKKGQ